MIGEARMNPENTLTLTEQAARRIAALRQAEDNEGLMLRVSVLGGGCQGFQYGFALDDTRRDDDIVFEQGGAMVVVDEISLGLLGGAELDYVDDLVGSYFALRNPNAVSSCGCGNSFSTG